MSIFNEKRKLVGSMIYPFLLLLLMWVVKIIETTTGYRFSSFGVIPLEVSGLPGIVTAPFIHGDFQHLISNSIPVFLLASGLFYFYDKKAFQILLLAFILPGLWVWLFARGNSSHIGASGVTYALASFHVFSGLIKREKRVLAFALIVLFLYGSMVWGIFPDFYPNRNISWESHLMGGIAGFLLALYYRREGPQEVKQEWQEHDEEWEDRIRRYHGISSDDIELHYHYKEKTDKDKQS